MTVNDSLSSTRPHMNTRFCRRPRLWELRITKEKEHPLECSFFDAICLLFYFVTITIYATGHLHGITSDRLRKVLVNVIFD